MAQVATKTGRTTGRKTAARAGKAKGLSTAGVDELRSLSCKDLLSIEQLSPAEIELILDQAGAFKQVAERAVKKVPTLQGRTLVLLFLEPSTRTMTSFDLAAKRLSADIVNISAKSSSVVKGESLKDTAKTLEAMNPDIVVVRHSSPGGPKLLAGYTKASVVNAGDGSHEHPTQALLDLFTIRESLGRLKGLRIAIVGDIAHSRVARSNILAMTKMGAQVTVVGPPTLIPPDVESLGAEVSHHLEDVLPDTDVVYLLRLQLERQAQNLLPSLREYAKLYGLDSAKLALAPPEALVMHPGPMNRGVEISSEVADLPQALITAQVANGIAVRMAVLFLLSGGARGEGAGGGGGGD